MGRYSAVLMFLPTLALLCLPVLAVAAVAQDDGGNPASALVRQLGDDEFQVRRSASRRLAALGLNARDALETGLAHPDPQVRRCCRWILEQVLETDYQRRLQAFAADTEGKREWDLPGWERFCRVAGRDSAARKLFVEMQRNEGGLLISADAGSQVAAESLNLRLRQAMARLTRRGPQQQREVPVGTVAAMLLVCIDPRLDLPDHMPESQYMLSLVQQTGFRKALTDSQYKSAARRLFGQWIRLPVSVNVLHTKLRLAVQYDVKEGLELAVRAIENRKNVATHSRVYALTAIGQLGGKEHLATLATMLDDTGECARRTVSGVVTTTQVRDAALAWLIHLTGQSHAEYGQDRAKTEFERISKVRRHHLNVSYFGFTADARKRALEKWQAYVADHPLPKPPQRQAADTAATPDPKRTRPKPAPVAVPGPHGGEDAQKLPGLALDETNRLFVRKFIKARQLCELQRYAEAVQLFDEILRTRSDCSFQPDTEVPLFCCLKAATERLLGGLPSAGRKAYRFRFEPLAGRLLAEAVATGRADALRVVADRFVFTSAGAEATYLLAVDRFNHGHPLHAALYLDRLRNLSPEAGRFEPTLSALLAACWHRAGMPQAAEAVLLQLQAEYPGATVRIAGREQDIFTRADEARTWLESFIGRCRTQHPGEAWAMLGGGPTRNVVTDAGGPYLRAEVLTTICSDSLLNSIVDRLRKGHLEGHRVALPRMHPLVVGETILLRTATHIRAVARGSGKLLWESPLEDSLRHYLRNQKDTPREPAQESLSRGVEQRFWDDAAFGTLASDGRCVFGVEDLSFAFDADFRRTVVMPDGRRRLDPGSLKKHNMLTAYDVRSGKLRWEIGGPPGIAGVRQGGTLFLGPPLPLGTRLYAVACVGNQTRLLELDARTGELVNTIALSTPEEKPESPLIFFTRQALQLSPPQCTGATPSYADGVIVCPAPENHFIAVDLTTRRPLWIYRVPRPEPLGKLAALIALPPGMVEPAGVGRDNCWADAGTTIAQGRVLLTPPGCDQLICLSLADGHRQWSIPRRNGLYVGGAHLGNVLVVGRGSVWAVKLADGTPAWPHGETALPPGALPSGRGYLGEGCYYLPLSTAEVAGIDLRSGRLASRSRSPEGIVPGNLVACRGSVLSQAPHGVWNFSPLSVRRDALAAAAAQRPDDPRLLTEFGETLLCDGRLVEAAEVLWRAVQIDPAPRTRQALVQAVIDGLRLDLEGFHDWARRLGSLIDDPQHKRRFLEQLALSFQGTDQLDAAFQTYLELIDLEGDQPQMKRFAAGRVARCDRWIRARLEALRAAADPKLRGAMDRQIADRLQSPARQRALRFFGSHPAAADARLQLAAQLAEDKKYLEAERQLRHVLHSPSEARQNQAVALLAMLLHAADRPDAAAPCYGFLCGQLAETVCLDGKTGRELFEALPAGDPVRVRLASRGSWPTAEFHVELSPRVAGVTHRLTLSVMDQRGRFDPKTSVEYDFSKNRFVGRDGFGRQHWEIVLTDVDKKWNAGASVRYGGRSWTRGHLCLVRLPNRVIAISTIGPKATVLWSKELQLLQAHVPGMPMIPIGMVPGIAFGMGMPGQSKKLPASKPLSVAVGRDYVCFQQGGELTAVDPLSGELLWSRDDVRKGSDLFGDDQLVFVTPPDSDQARVFSVVDGEQVGCRRVPPLAGRMWTCGRHVVTWSGDAQQARLTFTDPWQGKDLWQREFRPKSQPWLIGGDEVAVCDPEGRAVVVRLAQGNVVLEAQLDPVPDLDGIAAIRCRQRYVLVTNRPSARTNVVSIGATHGSIPINGRAYGFDRKSGQRLWAADVPDLAMPLSQPGEVPVLVFVARVYEREKNVIRSATRLLCLDARTGRALHSEAVSGRTDACEIHCDPDKTRIEIRSDVRAVTLTFAEQPESPRTDRSESKPEPAAVLGKDA